MRYFRKFFNYYLSPEKELARKIKSVVGFTPSRLKIFKLAFYHKSMNDKTAHDFNNERLEYLGDAILSTVVAEYLFKKYPNKAEGFLTKMRSKIVKRKTLNEIADKMGIDMILTDYSQGNLSKSMLGNAFEALIGAIYIEYGYNTTRDYIIRHVLRKYLDIHELESTDDNYKSQLLEWCQKTGKEVDYKVLSKFKHEKRDRFRIAVLIDGQETAEAEDFNKKSAEQSASKVALKIISAKEPKVESVVNP